MELFMMRSLHTVFGVGAGKMALMKLEHLGLLMLCVI